MGEVYDAGAVRASADLNRDPFIEGLRAVTAEGRKFASERFTATADIDIKGAAAQIEALRVLMARLNDDYATMGRNTAEAAKIAAAQARAEAAQARADGAKAKADADAASARARADAARYAADAAHARAELAQIRTQAARDREAAAAARRLAPSPSEIRESRREFSLLRTAIEQLGPPLVPLAGGVLAITAALAGLGPAGILAFKGIQAEMKAGTPIGQQYNAGLRTLKSTLTDLEKTASRGVLTGFEQSVAKINSQMPLLDGVIDSSSRKLGDITQHLVGGLIGGFQTFNPLILQSEGYLDHLAATFERWATGPGGAHFAQTLSTDLEHVIGFLHEAGPAVGRFFAAFQPVGLGMLDTLGGLLDILNHIPVGVLQAGATAYIAFRTAVTITTGLEAATAALTRLAAAETAAAGAGAAGAAGGAAGAATGTLGRTAGILATTTRRVLPYAAAWAAAAVTLHAASAATKDWIGSTDTLKGVLGTTADVASKLFSFHPIDAFNSLLGDTDKQATAQRQQAIAQQQINSTLGKSQGGGFVNSALLAGGGGLSGNRAAIADARNQIATLTPQVAAAKAEFDRLRTSLNYNADATYKADVRYAGLNRRLQDQRAVLSANLRLQHQTNQAVDNAAHQYRFGNADRIGAQQRNVFAQNPSLTAGATGLADYTKQLGQAIKAEESWTKITDDNTVKIGKNVYETKAWNAALAAAGGDQARAIGLMAGHRAALEDDRLAAQGAADMQARLSEVIGAAENKYKINDQQLDLYATALGVTSQALATGEVSQRDFLTELGKAKGVIDNGSTALNGWLTALMQFQAGTDTAASRAALLGAAMVSLNGDTLSWQSTVAHSATANQQFVDAFRSMDRSAINLRTGMLDFRNAAAGPVLDALTQLQSAAMNSAAAWYQHEVSIGRGKQAAKEAADVYYNNTRNALIAEAGQLGLTHEQAKKLADTYFHWPKDAKTQIEALGAKDTNTLLDALGQQLAILTGKPWLLTVGASVSPAAAKVLDALPALSNGRSGVNVGVGAQAAGGLVKAYAGGGYEKHVPQLAATHPGSVRVWAEPETRGEAYIPLANDWRRPRAKAIASQTVSKLGGVAFFDGGGYTGGYSGVTGTGPVGGAAGGGIGSKIADLLRHLSYNQIGTYSIKQLDKASASTLTQWAASILADARKALDLHAAPSSLVKQIKADNRELASAVKERERIAADKKVIDGRVAADRANIAAERTTVSDAIMGGFDIGTSGNGYRAGIRASLEQQLADAKKFATLRARAKAMGLDPRLLRKITEEGPAQAGKNLEAIVNGGKGFIATVNSEYGELAKVAGGVGQSQGLELYGKQLARDTAKQLEYTRDLTAATHRQNRILEDVRDDVHDLERKLTAAKRQG